MTLTCFDSHHGRPVELVDFSHDPAVFGSRLVPNKKTDSRVLDKFSPFIIDIDSIIDVYVPIRRLLSYTKSNPGVVPMICFTCSIHFVSFTILPRPSGVNTIIEP